MCVVPPDETNVHTAHSYTYTRSHGGCTRTDGDLSPAQLSADKELAKLAKQLLPKLRELTTPRTEKESSPYASPANSPPQSPPNTVETAASPRGPSVMYKNQQDLPRLPLPDLEDTCELFLEVTQTVVDSASYETTKKAVADFLSGSGPKLHKKLTEIDNLPENEVSFTFFCKHPDYN